MLTYIRDLLSSDQLAPHGYCLLWRPGLIWTHVGADMIIGVSYVAIASTLAIFVRKRGDLAFGWIFWCFAAFILLCGTTHFFSIVTFWQPYYGVEALIKVATALVSATTAIALVFLIPRALALPSPQALRVANQALEQEIATRAQAEAMLRQSQKLESLGHLTGGVAHDFNNLLTPIRGALELLGRRMPDDGTAQQLINAALTAANSAATLVGRLLSFSRQQHLTPKLVDIGKLLTGMTDLLQRSIGPTIDLRLNVDEGRLLAFVDANQLEMAVLNLCVNSKDAMPHGGMIRISVASRNRTSFLDEGGHSSCIVIKVADNGQGMSEETAQRALEPFYSTKEIGKGTGLGLSSVHGLATQLGGGLTIESTPGAGTTVEMWIPAAQGDAKVDNATNADARAASAPDGSSPRQRILLVDDEPLVRLTTLTILRDQGYDVVEAASGNDALQRVEGGFVPDLLITDQMMPGMRGDALAATLLIRHPSLKVLIATGFSGNAPLAYPIIGKPYGVETLISHVAAVLGKRN